MSRRQPRERRQLQLDATADMECESWTSFVCGSLLHQGEVRTFWHDQEEEFVDALLLLEGVCWWHGGSRYDLRWLFEKVLARRLPYKVKTRDVSSILSLKVGRSWHRDSYLLWPVPLSTFAAGTSAPKQALKIACKCGRDCGGYCGVTRSALGWRKRRIQLRCEADVRSVWEGVERLAAVQEDLDVDGANSLGSSAWATVRRLYKLPSADRSRSRHAYNREGYHSGRTEVIRPEAPEANEYDKSGAYPSLLASLPLPLGEPTRLWGEDARAALLKRQAGIYDVSVLSPSAFLPVLPWRSPKRRVGYPVGRMRGKWTELEITAALARGYELLKVHSGQVYPRRRIILGEWVERMWQHRERLQREGSPLEGYVKALCNSLVGVFGTRPVTEELVVDPPRGKMRGCPCRGLHSSRCDCRGRCCDGCVGECGALLPLSPEHALYVRRRWQLTERHHVVWAAWITAAMRLELLEQAALCDGGDDLIHVGTDGLLCEGSRPTGTGLGGWRLKRKVQAVKLWHGNSYRSTDAETGQLLTRAAGHSRHSASQLLREGTAVSWQPVGLRRGLAEGKIFDGRERPATLQRVVDGQGRRWYGSRVEDGERTRAPTVEELAAL